MINGNWEIDDSKLTSFVKITNKGEYKRFTRWMITLVSIIFVFMFLPWTQNISSKGKITTLYPNQRPQTINSVISGKIDKWYIIEGQHVKKGDTLVHITEVKEKFFDPKLIDRTQQQLLAKQNSLAAYTEKISALKDQISSYEAEWGLKSQVYGNKIQQKLVKVTIDSVAYITAKNNFEFAQKRLIRADTMYQEDIYTLTELESKKIKLQESLNKLISTENKFVISKSDLLNSKIERNNLANSFRGKISKSKSDLYSAQSLFYSGQAEIAKLENKLTNFKTRNGLYYITSPIDGYITKTYYPGSGEIVKEGKPVISLMPEKINIAIEMYVKPVDLPLVDVGERIRIIFDGWPAIAFSGWPSASFGTFGGEVCAIDKVISKNGKYRVLIIPDKKDEEWPKELRVGSAAHGIFMLNDVPVWYEVWRQINGFPPDYYDSSKSQYKLDPEVDKKYHTK